MDHRLPGVLRAADGRGEHGDGLAPSSVQELCSAVEQTFHLLRPAVPACVTDLQAIEAFTDRVTAAVVTRLDTHVTNPSTRHRRRQALSQACQREALRRG